MGKKENYPEGFKEEHRIKIENYRKKKREEDPELFKKKQKNKKRKQRHVIYNLRLIKNIERRKKLIEDNKKWEEEKTKKEGPKEVREIMNRFIESVCDSCEKELSHIREEQSKLKMEGNKEMLMKKPMLGPTFEEIMASTNETFDIVPSMTVLCIFVKMKKSSLMARVTGKGEWHEALVKDQEGRANRITLYPSYTGEWMQKYQMYTIKHLRTHMHKHYGGQVSLLEFDIKEESKVIKTEVKQEKEKEESKENKIAYDHLESCCCKQYEGIIKNYRAMGENKTFGLTPQQAEKEIKLMSYPCPCQPCQCNNQIQKLG